jgi:Uncharacterized membrane protein (homolog of Drosophila rhomboid)
MPLSFKDSIDTAGFTEQQFTMLAYLSMNDLNWQGTILNETQVTGRTKMGLFISGEQVQVQINNNIAVIESHSMQRLSFSNTKSKTAVASLIEYININKRIYSPEQLSGLYSDYFQNAPGQNTSDKLVVTKGKHYATYSLMAVNTIVFLVMVINGISFFAPSVMDIYKWGANVRLYTLGGEWWRLITSMFLHIGFVHLFLNMYALFFVGRYLEPIINKWNLLVIYLCTGVLASLTSIWWSGARVCAGASGAIFGMFGTFIALLTTNLIDRRVRFGLLQSFVIFVVYSLFSGMQPGIDNAAHMGGLVSGMFFGYIFYFAKAIKKSTAIAALFIIVFTTGFSSYYVIKNKSYKIQLIRYFNRLNDNETKGLDVIRNYEDKTTAQKIVELNTIAAPAWHDCIKIIDSIAMVPQDTLVSKQKIILLREYVNSRIKENSLLFDAEKNNRNNAASIDSVRAKILIEVDSIKRLAY